MMVLRVLLFLAAVSLAAARIPIGQRKFNSTKINAVVDDFKQRMKDTTIELFSVNSTSYDAFVITGDIHAQWLRDSTNQVLPYIQFAKDDRHLRDLLCGLITRQANDIIWDPFANAFNKGNEGSPQMLDKRKPKMTLHVFEGKYELDSLAAALKLAWKYFELTNDTTCFASSNQVWLKSVRVLINTVKEEQKGTLEENGNPAYTFERITTSASETLSLGGRGATAKRCGLSKSGFRPSDDANLLPFHVAGNAMVSVELLNVAKLLLVPGPTYDPALSKQAADLGNEIRQAVFDSAVVTQDGQQLFAYEVDGFGSRVLQDDSNVPSLLSLPYLGFVPADHPVYVNTRRFVWSDRQPWFFKGTAGEGIGGPHCGYNMIWPMTIIMKAMTSTNDSEIMQCFEMIKVSAAGTGFMHEAFYKDDPKVFTRSWFAWANALLGELILKVAKERPHLIF